MSEDMQDELKVLQHLLDVERGHAERLRALLKEERNDNAETREQFLARVDSSDSRHEQALFIAIEHLQYMAEGNDPAGRMAGLCLESIDARLGQQR